MRERHSSLRLRRGVFERLRVAAERSGVAQTALMQRYVEEGLAMNAHPMIVFRDGPRGRRPMLEGSRYEVAEVVDAVRRAGCVAVAAERLGLKQTQVRACLRYFDEYGGELAA